MQMIRTSISVSQSCVGSIILTPMIYPVNKDYPAQSGGLGAGGAIKVGIEAEMHVRPERAQKWGYGWCTRLIG